MFSYYVSIGGREYDVKVDDSQVLLNDEPVQCDLISLNGNGLHQLSRQNQSVEVYLRNEDHGAYEVLIGGRRLIAHVESGHRRAVRQHGRQNSGEVTAQMAGLIVDLQVEVGDRVEKGDVLMVQEAMKMQMPLPAPCSGRVAELTVEVGSEVEKGGLLARITTSQEAKELPPVEEPAEKA